MAENLPNDDEMVTEINLISQDCVEDDSVVAEVVEDLTKNVSRVVTRAFSNRFFSSDIYFIDFLPSYLHYPDVYVTVITALVLSLVATLYPAWSATKVDPAQVLGQL